MNTEQILKEFEEYLKEKDIDLDSDYDYDVENHLATFFATQDFKQDW